METEAGLAGNYPDLNGLDGALIILTPERVAAFQKTAAGWLEQDHTDLPVHANVRDPRGMLARGTEEHSLSAFVPGAACAGSTTPASLMPGGQGVGL